MRPTRGQTTSVQAFVPSVPAGCERLGFSETMSDHVRDASLYLSKLATDGLVPITMHEPRGDVFLDVSIEGVRYQAFAETDPFVAHKGYGGWCQLGVATIDRSCGLNGGLEKWMVCKYSRSEGRIDLSMLSEAGRRTFAVMFGVPIGRLGPSVRRPVHVLRVSGARWLDCMGEAAAAQVRGQGRLVELPGRLESSDHAPHGDGNVARRAQND